MLSPAEEKEFNILIEKWMKHFKYMPQLYEKKIKDRKEQENHFLYRIDEIIRDFSEIRYAHADLKNCDILEIGCGMGGFLVALSLYGVKQPDALEFNPDYCRITELRSKKYGLKPKIINTQIEDYANGQKKYDLIIMLDVLEHVKSPEVSLKHIIELLKPEGALYLNIINRFALTDTHYHLKFINFLPRKLGNFFALKLSKKDISLFKDNQALLNMHYFTRKKFESISKKVGFKRIIRVPKKGLIYKLPYDIFTSTWTYILIK